MGTGALVSVLQLSKRSYNSSAGLIYALNRSCTGVSFPSRCFICKSVRTGYACFLYALKKHIYVREYLNPGNLLPAYNPEFLFLPILSLVLPNSLFVSIIYYSKHLLISTFVKSILNLNLKKQTY